MRCECETHSDVCWTQELLTAPAAMGGGKINANRVWERVINDNGKFFCGELAFLRERRSGQAIIEDKPDGGMCVRVPNEYHFSLWRRGEFKSAPPWSTNSDEKGYYWTRVHTTQDVTSVIMTAHDELDRLMERDAMIDWSEDR